MVKRKMQMFKTNKLVMNYLTGKDVIGFCKIKPVISPQLEMTLFAHSHKLTLE
jgi:hypothetical protein